MTESGDLRLREDDETPALVAEEADPVEASPYEPDELDRCFLAFFFLSPSSVTIIADCSASSALCLCRFLVKSRH